MKILRSISGLLMLITLVVLSSMESFAQEKKVNKDSALFLIEKSIRGCIGWAKTKDLALLYSITANDSSYLEVQPGERIVRGFEDFKEAEKFWMSPDFKAISYEIRDLA